MQSGGVGLENDIRRPDQGPSLTACVHNNVGDGTNSAGTGIVDQYGQVVATAIRFHGEPAEVTTDRAHTSRPGFARYGASSGTGPPA